MARLLTAIFGTRGYGTCQKCKLPWCYLDYHVTNYNQTRGCFPLCEYCWQSLTPEDRLPFYKDLLISWQRWEAILESETKHNYINEWRLIRRAVLAGK